VLADHYDILVHEERLVLSTTIKS